jgi:hypothetical protein
LGAQAAPIPDPSPKPRSKNVLIVAVVAVIVVVALVLAAVLVALPSSSQAAQSTPESTMNMYLDGIRQHNATKMIDSTLMHFDAANRSTFINSLGSQSTGNYLSNISIVSMDAIALSDVPVKIEKDMTNFTTVIQKVYKVTVQESQFLKVTIKQTGSSGDSNSSTAYLLLSKVDGKWYFDLYVSYSAEDWAADRSMSEKGWGNYPGGLQTTTTPIGFFTGTKSSGYWLFSLESISDPSVKFSDCMFSLTVGNQESSRTSVSTSTWFAISLSSSARYTMEVVDSGASGYLSVGDLVEFGPIGGMGMNPAPPKGTLVTLTVYYNPTGEAIASGTLVA